jgi:hypothetical protein
MFEGLAQTVPFANCSAHGVHEFVSVRKWIPAVMAFAVYGRATFLARRASWEPAGLPQSGNLRASMDLMDVRKLFLDSQLSALQLHDQRLVGQRTVPFFGDAPFKTGMFGCKSADMRQFHSATSSRTPDSTHSDSRIAARAHGQKIRADMDVSASTRSSGRVVMLPQSPYLASPSASVCPKRAIVRIPVAAKR